MARQETSEPIDEWVKLDDFRPGIYARSMGVLGSAGHPAQLGAAQITNTYRCFALPEGGLAPLPARTTSFSIAAPEGTPPVSGYWIVGFLAFPISGAFSATPDALFVGVSYRMSAGNQQRHRLYRVRAFGSGFDTLQTNNSTWSGVDIFELVWLCSSRIHPTNPVLPGTPICAATWAAGDGSSDKYIAVFPDPAAPNVTAALNLSISRWGTLLAHQGRLVLLEYSLYPFGASGNVATNEQISFTDPPNSQGLGNQQEVFVQEYPIGYSAFGSISAGELFLVKQMGGGVIASGDIANPTITRLPGVIGGYGAVSNRAASTPVGLFYASFQAGVCNWRGSDTSQVVSDNIDPQLFFDETLPGQLNGMVSFESWGNWVYMSSNWVYDIVTRSWWKCEDSSVANMLWWSRGFLGSVMYGAPAQFVQGNPIVAYEFDMNTPATSFSWQGHPIPVSVVETVDILEMVLLAQGSGTVTVTLTNSAGATQVETFSLSSTSFPKRQWKRTQTRGDSVVVRIQSNGGGTPAPVVYSLDLGIKKGPVAA